VVIQELDQAIGSCGFKVRAGWSREHGTDSTVVGTRLDRGISFFKSMRADSNEQVIASVPPCFCEGQIVLAKVHSIGISGEGHVNPVVDDDAAPMRSCQVDEPAGPFDEHTIGQILLPELDALPPGLYDFACS
jgi:hypothetical protein